MEIQCSMFATMCYAACLCSTAILPVIDGQDEENVERWTRKREKSPKTFQSNEASSETTKQTEMGRKGKGTRPARKALIMTANNDDDDEEEEDGSNMN